MGICVRRLVVAGVILAVCGGGIAAPALAQAAFDCTTVSQIPQLECEALVALYAATDGSNWSEQTHWLATDAPCNWHGVQCQEGHVQQLDLHDNSLTGSLPPALEHLTELRLLNVSDNRLSGILPFELSRLANLETFHFHFTLLCIPADFAFLDWLDQINRKSTTGRYCNTTDCSKVNNLAETDCKALKTLFDKSYGIGWKNATSWMTTSNPCAWDGVTCTAGRVTALDLRDNAMNGPIPKELGNMIHLETLRLNDNSLTGAVPRRFGNLASLKELFLNGNRLRGPIPPEIGNLISLKLLFLSHNLIGGTIPPEIGNLASLKQLTLSKNQLVGTLPPEIGQLDSLEVLTVYENPLSGTLPLTLTQLKRLQLIFFQKTDLCVPPDSTFQSWLDQVSTVIGTNFACTSTAVEAQAEMPTDHALVQNYPNPFNRSTTIAFTVARQSHVRVQVFDVRGRLVATLVDGQRPEGFYRVVWDAKSSPSGVYIYRLQAGRHVETKQMVRI